ncbi:hypothetical protein BGX21_007439 [Mortierella sp. AD011]|nr:hypothetical protein BGX20_010638 [Mortierella sp. AD010]KAF9398676.1 hypothetical protein BGX21_007439 [Mortierella sp. AD011]
MSIYGFSTTIAGILFSTTIGSLVDTTPRLSEIHNRTWGAWILGTFDMVRSIIIIIITGYDTHS